MRRPWVGFVAAIALLVAAIAVGVSWSPGTPGARGGSERMATEAVQELPTFDGLTAAVAAPPTEAVAPRPPEVAVVAPLVPQHAVDPPPSVTPSPTSNPTHKLVPPLLAAAPPVDHSVALERFVEPDSVRRQRSEERTARARALDQRLERAIEAMRGRMASATGAEREALAQNIASLERNLAMRRPLEKGVQGSPSR